MITRWGTAPTRRVAVVVAAAVAAAVTGVAVAGPAGAGSSALVSITKTDGVTTAVPGGSVTYTITVANAGGAGALATVTDNFPSSLTTVNWTCQGANGGSCGTSTSGSGNIDNSVTIPIGGTVTYTAVATISPSATGTLTNTATVNSIGDPDPSNNTATDTDTLTPEADLEITKTDGVATARPGGTVTYTIVASNEGLSDAPGATVTDTFPASLTPTWTCAGAGGGTCTASGSGNINDTVNVPADGSVTYTVSAAVSPSATGTLTNTATVVAPAGVTDDTPGNNAATDADSLNGAPVANNDSYPASEDTTLAVNAAAGVLANDTDAELDPLTATLGTAPHLGAVTLNPDGSFTYQPNTNATGVDTFAYTVHDPSGPGSTATVTVTIAPTPGTRNQQWLIDAYPILLGRPVDAPGLAFWSGQLDGGRSRDSVAGAIILSPEGIDHSVRSSFEAILDRSPDAAGLAFWRSFLTSGHTPQQLDAQLAGSAEFLAGAGGTTSGFVNEVYLELLGRPADSAGAAFWTAQVNGGRSRVDVAAALLGSDEGTAHQLDVIFRAILSRSPEPAAVTAFRPTLQSGDRRAVVVVVVASTEFFNRAAPT